jgi:hypothetical protein
MSRLIRDANESSESWSFCFGWYLVVMSTQKPDKVSSELGLSVNPSEPDKAKETTAKQKGTRSRPVKVRKHKLTTVYKQDVADQLDRLYAEGQTAQFIISSPDIRGFEIISFLEE